MKYKDLNKRYLLLSNGNQIDQKYQKITEDDVVEIQGQWYLISSTILNKSSKKIPITEEQAYMLKEVLL